MIHAIQLKNLEILQMMSELSWPSFSSKMKEAVVQVIRIGNPKISQAIIACFNDENETLNSIIERFIDSKMAKELDLLAKNGGRRVLMTNFSETKSTREGTWGSYLGKVFWKKRTWYRTSSTRQDPYDRDTLKWDEFKQVDYDLIETIVAFGPDLTEDWELRVVTNELRGFDKKEYNAEKLAFEISPSGLKKIDLNIARAL